MWFTCTLYLDLWHVCKKWCDDVVFLFQLALDIEVESKESNRYMDDHMVKTFPHRTYEP